MYSVEKLVSPLKKGTLTAENAERAEFFPLNSLRTLRSPRLKGFWQWSHQSNFRLPLVSICRYNPGDAQGHHRRPEYLLCHGHRRCAAADGRVHRDVGRLRRGSEKILRRT